MIESTALLTLEDGAALTVQRFELDTRLSGLFEARITIHTADPSVELSNWTGRAAKLVVHVGRCERSFDGLIAQASQVHPDPSAVSTYSLVLVPRLWVTTQRSGYRVHQHKSIPEIVGSLLEEWRIDHRWELEREHRPLEYKVQYGESDFHFLSRLLEEAGISYAFDGSEGRSLLVLSDTPEHAPLRPDPLEVVADATMANNAEFAREVRLERRVTPSIVTLRDYDHRAPSFGLFATAAPSVPGGYEQYHYVPGAFLVEGNAAEQTPAADDRGVARRLQSAGEQRAQLLRDAHLSEQHAVQFDSNAFDLLPGIVFRLNGHPHPELEGGRPLIVTAARFEGGPRERWRVQVEAAYADRPVRPLPSTPKPVAHGVEVAVVVGPAGQEIHTDEFGRVRLQFPWDREGRFDETSSCWMRVSHGWGGAGYGFSVVPRMGQEVLVIFENADPDLPIVAGRVFDGLQPVPYRLPEESTVSGWKSQASLGGIGFNELRFDDRKGDELVYVQAEKNLRKLVKNDETITVLRDRRKDVGSRETDTTEGRRFEVTRQTRHELISGRRTTFVDDDRLQLVRSNATHRTEYLAQRYVAKDEDHKVGGDATTLVRRDVGSTIDSDQVSRVGGNSSLIIGGARQEKVGSYAVHTGTSLSIRAGDVFTAGAQDVTLVGPGGFIRVDGAGVTIRGTTVHINVDGEPGEGQAPKPKTPKEAREAPLVQPTMPRDPKP